MYSKVIIALLASNLLLPTYALPSQSSLAKRDETKAEFDEKIASYKRQGLCIDYKALTTKPSAELCYGDPAKGKCDKNLGAICYGANFEDPTIQFYDPDGDQYSVGECQCISQEANDKITKEVTEALTAIGVTTCNVWLEAIKWSIEHATLAMPGGQIKTVITWLLRLASAWKTLGGGKEQWKKFVKDQCGEVKDVDLNKAWLTFAMDKAEEKLGIEI